MGITFCVLNTKSLILNKPSLFNSDCIESGFFYEVNSLKKLTLIC